LDAPPYQVAQRKGTYELRIYGAYYVCTAPYAKREQGLASLMGYIEGGNEREQTFPATQPLMMRYTDMDGGEFDKCMFLVGHLNILRQASAGRSCAWAPG